MGGKSTVFQLTGLNEKSPYFEKTYSDLKETNEAAERKLRNTVLRSVIIKQLNPEDDTSIYHIFERLNTGGTPLTGQEIHSTLGEKPFRLGKGLNAALFDAVFTTFAAYEKIPSAIMTKYKHLIQDDQFEKLVTASTTDKESVANRLKIARQKLFGAARR